MIYVVVAVDYEPGNESDITAADIRDTLREHFHPDISVAAHWSND